MPRSNSPEGKEKKRKYERECYRKNLDYRKRKLEKRKQWHKENLDKDRASLKKWRDNHPDEVKLRYKEWKNKDPDKARIILRKAAVKWNKANKEKYLKIAKESRARYAARKKKALVENVNYEAVFIIQKGICGICGEKVNPKDWHLDHIIPLTKGGKHGYSNVQVSHPRCNLLKQNKLIFINVKGKLITKGTLMNHDLLKSE